MKIKITKSGPHGNCAPCWWDNMEGRVFDHCFYEKDPFNILVFIDGHKDGNKGSITLDYCEII